MAKKQSRRSVSISRATYERLRAYCETNGLAMSQFIEGRIGDFLGRPGRGPQTPADDDEDTARKVADRIFTF